MTKHRLKFVAVLYKVSGADASRPKSCYVPQAGSRHRRRAPRHHRRIVARQFVEAGAPAIRFPSTASRQRCARCQGTRPSGPAPAEPPSRQRAVPPPRLTRPSPRRHPKNPYRYARPQVLTNRRARDLSPVREPPGSPSERAGVDVVPPAGLVDGPRSRGGRRAGRLRSGGSKCGLATQRPSAGPCPGKPRSAEILLRID